MNNTHVLQRRAQSLLDMTHATPRRRAVFAVLWALLASRAAFYAGMLAAPLLVPSLQSAMLSDMQVGGPAWLAHHWRWDSLHYYNLAAQGYPSQEALAVPSWMVHLRSAFFPLLPLLIRAVAFVLNGMQLPAALPITHATVPVLLSGVLLAHGLAAVAFWFVYQIAYTDTGDHGIAQRTVLYVALFPLAFFYAVPYTEALFLAASCAALLMARRRRWISAGLWAMAAAATRSTGMVLLPVLVCELTLAWRAGTLARSERWRALGGIALVPMGLLLFMLHLWQRTGDPLLFVHAQRYWGREGVFPLVPLVRALHYVLHPAQAESALYAMNVINLLVVLLFLGVFAVGARRWRASYVVYGVMLFALVLSSALPGATALQSVGRYSMVFFPVFMRLAQWGENRALHRRLLLCWVPLYITFTALFVQWVYFV